MRKNSDSVMSWTRTDFESRLRRKNITTPKREPNGGINPTIINVIYPRKITGKSIGANLECMENVKAAVNFDPNSFFSKTEPRRIFIDEIGALLAWRRCPTFGYRLNLVSCYPSSGHSDGGKFPLKLKV